MACEIIVTNDTSLSRHAKYVESVALGINNSLKRGSCDEDFDAPLRQSLILPFKNHLYQNILGATKPHINGIVEIDTDPQIKDKLCACLLSSVNSLNLMNPEIYALQKKVLARAALSAFMIRIFPSNISLNIVNMNPEAFEYVQRSIFVPTIAFLDYNLNYPKEENQSSVKLQTTR
ncbi:MAG: hypothetical protein WCO33_03995 [bacterium]